MKVGDEQTRYGIDGVGLVKSIAQRDGTTINNNYDATQRLIGTTDNPGNSVSYMLDNMGNRIGKTVKDPTGNINRQVSRVFNDLNRLSAITAGETNQNSNSITVFDYDAGGRISSLRSNPPPPDWRHRNQIFSQITKQYRLPPVWRGAIMDMGQQHRHQCQHLRPWL